MATPRRSKKKRLRDFPPHPLRLWRESKDLDLAAAAKRLGLCEGYVHQLEAYRARPGPRALASLRDVTGIPAELFLDVVLRLIPSRQPKPRKKRRR